jgi:cytochrome c-type biogenesis protein CcmE
LLLATALIYTSFSASTVARTPSQLIAASTPGESYELTGKVAADSVTKKGDDLEFKVEDRKASPTSKAILVKYSGTVPDPFREGREVIVTGKVHNGVLIAEPNSLVTKCPSKFTNESGSSGTNTMGAPATSGN